MRSEDEIQRQDERSSETVKAAGCFCLGPPAGCLTLLWLGVSIVEALALLVTMPVLLGLFQPGWGAVRRFIEYRRVAILPPARKQVAWAMLQGFMRWHESGRQVGARPFAARRVTADIGRR